MHGNGCSPTRIATTWASRFERNASRVVEAAFLDELGMYLSEKTWGLVQGTCGSLRRARFRAIPAVLGTMRQNEDNHEVFLFSGLDDEPVILEIHIRIIVEQRASHSPHEDSQ